MTPRKLVFDLLQRSEKNKQYSNIVLDNSLKTCNMGDADKRLASTLFYGVIEKRITLDYIISKLSCRSLDKLDVSVLTALRLGIYQLAFLDRIPAHAAINESVSLVSRKSSGFVNAVLRAYTRHEKIEFPKEENFSEYLSVRYSVCEPLAQCFIDNFGKAEAENILKGFEFNPDITIRANTLKISRDELIRNIPDAQKTQNSPVGLRVKGSVRNLYGFEEGLFFVQDEASQICVEVLGALSEETILDVCSCPGSKSFGAAINMKNCGRVLSFDLHQSKLSLVNDGAKRLGIDIIKTNVQDGRQPVAELESIADRVICDVPCSGFGVLAKKPELRYKDPTECKALPNIQLDILDNVCRYVKNGGTLVYSSCTILPEENEKNIERFLSRHNDFSLCEWSVGSIAAPQGMLTLYPHTHATDGFFIAKLIRKQL